MFFIRSAFWLALLVAILPSDPKEQARMYQTASYALHRASTFCDRNKAVCDEASVYWDAFKVKLFVGATMVRALVNERLEARQHDTPLLERRRRTANRHAVARRPSPGLGIASTHRLLRFAQLRTDVVRRPPPDAAPARPRRNRFRRHRRFDGALKIVLTSMIS